MTAEYPPEQQNPPQPGTGRPSDQPPPRQRVPKNWKQGDPISDEWESHDDVGWQEQGREEVQGEDEEKETGEGG
jgi:hypothetical protein